MVDLGSVSIRGAFNHGRVRALWNNGILRAYGVNGLVLEVHSKEPTRKKGHLRAWDIQTVFGEVTARMKCITCGGRAWWRVTFTPAEQLWGSK